MFPVKQIFESKCRTRRNERTAAVSFYRSSKYFQQTIALRLRLNKILEYRKYILWLDIKVIIFLL